MRNNQLQPLPSASGAPKKPSAQRHVLPVPGAGTSTQVDARGRHGVPAQPFVSADMSRMLRCGAVPWHAGGDDHSPEGRQVMLPVACAPPLTEKPASHVTAHWLLKVVAPEHVAVPLVTVAVNGPQSTMVQVRSPVQAPLVLHVNTPPVVDCAV